MAQAKMLPAAQVAVVKKAYKALESFRAINSTMPLQYVTAFMLVAMEENLNVTEYAKRANTSQSLMTRHLQDLGSYNRYHNEGMGLVETYEDMADRRNKLVRLTTRGKSLLWDFTETLS
jgi:DNA-binding MarR family transcriptional regulator